MRSICELMRLDGRVALVAGGAGHIGTACATALSELGAAVAIVDIDHDRAADVAIQVSQRHGGRVEGFAVDLTDTDALQSLPGEVARSLGRIDILVNCAALVGSSNLKGWSVPFQLQSIETWRVAMEVNVTAAFALSQACTPWLQSSGHGSIINIASIYGLVGPNWQLYEGTDLSNPAAYAASKGALLQLTRWLSTTLAPTIRVNAITPGGVFRNHQEPFLTRYAQRTPLGRMATEEDMIGAVAYLASDLSSYVTGHSLVVDGGWTAW